MSEEHPRFKITITGVSTAGLLKQAIWAIWNRIRYLRTSASTMEWQQDDLHVTIEPYVPKDEKDLPTPRTATKNKSSWKYNGY